MNPIRRSRNAVIALFVLSVALRFWLAAQGGQRYFWDEERYDNGVKLYRAFASADMAAVRSVAILPAHALFNWFSAVVAAGQHLGAQLTPYGDWSIPGNIERTYWIGGLLLSLASSLNLLILHAVARRAGATEREALLALLFMAAANSAFYYSRHFFPYDAASGVALLAVWFAIGRPSNGNACLGGLCAGVTYHLYNGYWYLVPLVWLIQVYAVRNAPHRLRRWLLGAVAIAGALAFPVALGAALGGKAYWSSLSEFGSSVKLGLFSEGWSLPWEYFWHAEGVLGVAVVLLVGFAIFATLRRGHRPPGWVAVTLASLALAYGLLVLFSNGLGYFVVYARTVKPLVPMFCLLAGWALNLILEGRPSFSPLAVCAIGAAAAFNFMPHFGRVFPRDVDEAVMRSWGNPKRTLSITGSLYWFSGRPVTRPDLVLVNCRELYPVRSYVGFPQGKVLARISHPLSYRPFQYECHSPKERALVRSHDISIQLIQLTDPGAVPDNPPLSMLYQVEDRPTGYDRSPEKPAVP